MSELHGVYLSYPLGEAGPAVIGEGYTGLKRIGVMEDGKKKKHFKGTKDKLKGDFCEDQRKQLKIFEEKN